MSMRSRSVAAAAIFGLATFVCHLCHREAPTGFITARHPQGPPQRWRPALKAEEAEAAAPALDIAELEALVQAAEDGDPESQFYMGRLRLEGGNGLEKSVSTAAEWFLKAAQGGLASAQYTLGMLLMAGDDEGKLKPDPEAAAGWLEVAANNGDAQAQYFYGLLCMKGEVVPLDMDKATTMFGNAAEQGLAQAQHTIGMLLLDTPPDAAEEKVWAAHWLNKAADQNHGPSQLEIAKMFLYGVGMEKDPALAAQWCSSAANNGILEAQYMMGVFLLSGTGVEARKDWAAYWFEQAAQKGHPDAQYNYALMLEAGDGIPEDKEKAAYWFAQAEGQEQGEEVAAR